MVSNVTAILTIIRYISIFSVGLPLVFFLLFKIRTKEKSLRVIFFYILYCVLNEIVTYFLQSRRPGTIFSIYALFTIVEFSFFCIFYKYVLPKANPRKFIFAIWLVFTLFSVADFFFINRMTGFDSFTSGLQTIIIIGMCVYYLFLQIRGRTDLYIYSTSNFWIIITFLIYLSGTFFLYIMAETMVADKVFRIQYVLINSIFNILKNVLLSIAMMMKSGEEMPVIKKNYEWMDYTHKN